MRARGPLIPLLGLAGIALVAVAVWPVGGEPPGPTAGEPPGTGAAADPVAGAGKVASGPERVAVGNTVAPDSAPVLRVRVVDPAGRGVSGIPVYLVARAGEWVPGRAERPSWPLGVSAQEGRLSVPVDRISASARAADALQGRAPGGLGPLVPIDLEGPIQAVVTVRVPATGLLLVSLRNPDGGPVDGAAAGAQLQIGLAPGKGEKTVFRPENWRAFDSQGQARFPAVLGSRLALRAWVAGLALVEEVEGPVAGQWRREVVLTLPAEMPVLAGRALAPSGVPLANGRLRLDYRVDDRKRSLWTETGKGGAFRFFAPLDLIGQRPEPLTLVADEGMAALTLAAPLASGPLDLGDVPMVASPLVLSGQVVAPDGGDPSGVSLSVATRNAAGRWEAAQGIEVERVTDGRFEVRGRAPEMPLQLRVGAPGFVPVAPIEFAPGRTGLVVELRNGGALRATFLVETERSAEWLAPSLRSLDGTVREAREIERSGDAVRCAWSGLPAGSYRLRVYSRGFPRPLVERVLAVSDGEASLEPIDLRGRLHRFRIRVIDGQGRAVNNAQGTVILRGDEVRPWWGMRLAHGTVDVYAPAPVDLLVAAPGYRTVEVPGAFRDQLVTLHEAPVVHVELSRELSDVLRVTPVWVRLRPVDDALARVPVVLDTGNGFPLGRLLGAEPVERLLGGRGVDVALPVAAEWTVRLLVVSDGVCTELPGTTPEVVAGDAGTVELRGDLDAVRRTLGLPSAPPR